MRYWNGNTLVLAAAALALSASGALAALLGADSFDYAGTTLNGQSGGTNWGGEWTQSGTAATVTLSDDGASLSYPVTVPWTPAGGRVLQAGAGGSSYRLMGGTLNMTEGGRTLYASALIQQNTRANILFEFKDSLGNRRGGFGINSSGQFWINCNSSNQTTEVAAPGQTYLLVAKIVTGEGATAGTTPDVAYLKIFGPGWAQDTSVEPAVWDVQTQTTTGAILDRVVLRMDGTGTNNQVDELRIGTTWAAVAPEPASLTLLACGALFLRRRGM